MRSRAWKLLASLFLAMALPASGQVPAPYRSAEIRGRVLDEATHQPIEGAVVVARWEWLEYVPPRFHGGDYYSNSGAALHVGEAVTDRVVATTDELRPRISHSTTTSISQGRST